MFEKGSKTYGNINFILTISISVTIQVLFFDKLRQEDNIAGIIILAIQYNLLLLLTLYCLYKCRSTFPGTVPENIDEIWKDINNFTNNNNNQYQNNEETPVSIVNQANLNNIVGVRNTSNFRDDNESTRQSLISIDLNSRGGSMAQQDDKQLDELLLKNEEFITTKFCNYCNKIKVPRSHHCKTCGVCIIRRDHHCLMIGNCIGILNHKFFMLYTFYFQILSLEATVFCCYLFSNSNNNDSHIVYVTSVLLGTCSVFFYVIVAGLFFQHIYFIMQNITTNEQFLQITLPSPYKNEKTMDNFKEVFGRQFSYQWFLPTNPFPQQLKFECDGRKLYVQTYKPTNDYRKNSLNSNTSDDDQNNNQNSSQNSSY